MMKKQNSDNKGQLKYRNILWRLQIDQKTNEIFVRISALACKKRSDQKSGVRESK